MVKNGCIVLSDSDLLYNDNVLDIRRYRMAVLLDLWCAWAYFQGTDNRPSTWADWWPLDVSDLFIYPRL